MQSVPRLYNGEQLPLRKSLETAVRGVGVRCELGACLGVSGVELRVRQLEANLLEETQTAAVPTRLNFLLHEMTLMKVVIFATLLIASYAAPVYESHSLGHNVPVATVPHAPTVRYTHGHAVIAHAPVEVEHHAPANYEFKYGVNDGHTHDVKEQAEKRVGDKVEGYYSLLEPDGTTRTVHYTADHHNGFNAVVSKSGQAVHPAGPVHTAAAAPSYAHAAPVVSHPHAPSYSHAAPLVSYPRAPSYSHAAPLVSYAHAPSYPRATPAVSYSNTVGHGYPADSLGQEHAHYH
ncbi:hypothetical protein B7P43_G13675 [Cryptotermes secundus]|uniref:Cuticle protein 8 n=1 Tax=Cryptotermes secundus TaxID=105785 RepID=A0A2J7RMC3_9NEOP|nr:hypothetical protein B7P43_G13675 [Cryptotermes secundus]